MFISKGSNLCHVIVDTDGI